MTLSSKSRTEIGNILKKTIRDKLASYEPETIHAPFQHRLLGKDRYALFSFVQSMNTTFGMSIWEQVAVVLAKGAGNLAQRQYKLAGEIDVGTERFIANLHQQLRRADITSDTVRETEQIRARIKKGQSTINDPDRTVDFFTKVGQVDNLFDITSVKPNMKEFAALKLKLLRWKGLRLSQDKNIQIQTRLAIPYNPYYPDDYERWTLNGLFDLENGEILVAEQFWDFCGQGSVYNGLLEVFEEVGEELRKEIDKRFKEFK